MTTGAISVILALHHAVNHRDKSSVKTLLDGLTPEQQLKLLFTQDKKGKTALHDAARKGHTDAVKTLLDYLTPEQQLNLLSVQNKKGMTAFEEAAGRYTDTDTMRTLEHYQKEAQYGVNYRKFALFT